MTQETRVVNLKGRKPQALREGEVYIGRNLYMGGWAMPASKWGNPFTIASEKGPNPREAVLQKYEKYIRESPLLDELEELRGKTLACWCAPEGCHGDVLVRLLVLYAKKQ